MKTIKDYIKTINNSIDFYLPDVPNWCIWKIFIMGAYLMLK